MFTSNINGLPPGAVGARGMGGAQPVQGRLGQRLFKACRGPVMRAARSVSRFVGRLVHARSGGVPLVGAKTGSPPRAGVRKLDLTVACAAPRPTQDRDPSQVRNYSPVRDSSPVRQPSPVSPGAVSAMSLPSVTSRSQPGTPTSVDSVGSGVRLKPSRVKHEPPPTRQAPDGPPMLPPRPAGLDRLFSGNPLAALPARDGDSHAAPPPRGTAYDSTRPPRGMTRDTAPLPNGTPSDAVQAPAAMPVFHRRNPAGPITAQVGLPPAGPAPKPPGNDEPPR